MNTSQELKDFAAALAKAQSAIGHAVKSAENPAFKRGNKASKYADLSAIWEAARKPLAENGLAVMQGVSLVESGVTVTTRIIHASGQWVEFEPTIIPLEKRNAHGVGSGITYGRRFSLAAALGIVADDDDGNAAAGATTAPAANDAPVVEVKANPGISKARTWLNETTRHMRAINDPTELIEFLDGPDEEGIPVFDRAVKICMDYPEIWTGPEEAAGLKGQIEQVAGQLRVLREAKDWLERVSAAAKKQTERKAA